MTTWPGQEIGGTTFRPQQADPYRIPPDPVLAQRAQAEEERRRQDQARQEALARNTLAQGQASLQSQPLIDEGRRLENEAKARTLAPTLGADPRAEAIGKLTKVIEQIDYLYADSSDNGGWGETGWLGSKLRDVGGTAAYDLGQQTQNVEANAAFDALQAMRNSSPTGGALGQVTERELDLLKSSVANVNPNQSQEEFIRSLGQAKGIYLDRLRQLDPALADEIQNRGNPAVGPNGAITYDKRGADALAGMGPPGGGSPPSGGGFWGQAGASVKNALVGGVQGAAAGLIDFPMDVGATVERAGNFAVGRGGGAAMDAMGLPGAADWWRRGSDAIDSDLAGRPGLSDMIERASPTPPGMGGSRFASQLVGGMMVPIGPKAAPRVRPPTQVPQLAPNVARGIIREADDAGVRVMTSDVRPPTTFMGKIARAGGERIPFAGTGGPRQAQQAERIQAIRDLARDFGAEAGADFLGDVANDLASTRSGRIVSLTRTKNSVLKSTPGTFVAPRTVQAIGEQVRELARIDGEAFAPVIAELQRFGNNIISGKTIQEIEGSRKLLGAMFENPNLATLREAGQKAINAIYAPLREDMGAFIHANSGPAAAGAWAKANRELAGLAGELGDRTFRGVLQSAETTPENVARALFSKKPSEIRRLMGNLSPRGRAKAQGAVIFQAIEKSGGIDNISPDRFANEIDRLGKSVGVVFEGADLARVQGLNRLLQATKQAGVASAAPPTGVQNTPLIGGYAAGSIFGVGAVPALGVAGLMARAYESPRVRNLLIGLGKTQPGSTAESRLLQRILQTVTAQSQIRPAAANDAFAMSPGQLAAREQENN